MSRRAFLVAGLCRALERPPATATVPDPVQARLVAFDGTRSDPVEFSARWAVPPLKFRARRPETWSHLELVQGGRTRVWELYPSFATWEGDSVRISGVVW